VPPDDDPDDEDPPPLEPLFAVTEASLCDPVGCDPEGDPKSFVAPPFAHAAASAEAIAIPPHTPPPQRLDVRARQFIPEPLSVGTVCFYHQRPPLRASRAGTDCIRRSGQRPLTAQNPLFWSQSRSRCASRRCQSRVELPVSMDRSRRSAISCCPCAFSSSCSAN